MNLRTLRLHVAIVQGDELAQIALPCSSSAASFEPRRKVPRVSDTDLSGSGYEPAPAQCPRAPHPPAAGPLPVRFMIADLRPSPDAQDVVSFGAMEGTEEEDDAISVAASAREEWSNWITLRHGSDAGDLHHSDDELLSVLSKAVDELGLEWAPPAEPARSTLPTWRLCLTLSRDPRSSPYNQRACERSLSRQRSCSRWPLLSELETYRRFQMTTRVLNSGQVIADSP